MRGGFVKGYGCFMSGSQSEAATSAWMSRSVVYLWYVLGFSATLALGAVNLFYPFGEDQSVFLLVAKAMDQGAVLYVDTWHNKQPALYYFWLFAGRLFGFSEFGIHMLELLWLLFFSVVLMFTLRSVVTHSWVAALAPVATVGVYYATAGEYELTELEMLVNFPIFLSLWFVYKAVESNDRRLLNFFYSGIFAGIVVLFKLLVSGVVLAIWVTATVYILVRDRGRNWPAFVWSWFAAGLGSLLVIVPVLLYFWSNQALDELIWTAFVYPSAAFEIAPPSPKTRLITGFAFYISYLLPWMLYAAVAVWWWWRNRSDSFMALLLTWLVFSALVIGVQSFSWWKYHAFLLFAPTGIIAILGIDRVAEYVASASGRSRVFTILTSAVIGLPLVASLSGPFVKKAQPLIGTFVQGQGLQAYHWKVSKYYKQLWESSRFLTEPGALPGPIYVFADAMLYPFSGRECAHAIEGSGWDYWLPEQLRDIMDTLKRDKVPYIFVERREYKMAWMRPEVWNFLETYYEVHKRDDIGLWLKWREQPRIDEVK